MGLFSKMFSRSSEPEEQEPTFETPEWTEPEWTEESEQERVWSEVNQHLQEYGQALEDSSNRRMHAWAEKRQQQREQRK